MNRIVEELKKVGVFYIATVDAEGDPHVRPFGAVAEIGGKAYICTNNTKKCYKEMAAHPTVEISGAGADGTWLRLTAKAVRDDSDESRNAFLEQCPELKNMYSVGDGIFEVLALEDASCTKCSFTAAPEVIA
ncbi:pyridoxamine 5'-phosphate oxidase family protein [Ruminococcus sp.]|uniref:pyridoxamine 5'-phosphate oxidase family protein n=1 Tax=Ruminococcus sp. TaxID=41978 RepID=UPI0025E7C165|nr:pyridoxamine 5'-phosphate oxidase family protein [Ruminococcus sp.]MBQ8967730.1 pyridoxamine 5'-phosphate oxidase family protein [Ruminococcus sp.]